MSGSAWSAIFRLRQAREPLAWWEHALGVDFGGCRPFLIPCNGLAGRFYPCPDTGLPLRIRESGGRFRAFPTGDSAEDASDRELSWEDAQAWRLDHGRLRRGLAQALGLTGVPHDSDDSEIQLAGFCERGGCRRRVYVCHSDGSEAGVRAAADAAHMPEAGCLIFAERYAAAEHVLKARGVVLVALAECMTLDSEGLKGRCADACRGVQSDISSRITLDEIKKNTELIPEIRRKLDGVPLETAALLKGSVRQKLGTFGSVVEDGFAASAHFTNLTWEGKVYVIRQSAAVIIETLFIAQKSFGLPGLHQEEVFAQIYTTDKKKWPSGETRVQNFFRRGDAKRLWDDGLISHDGKGSFHLNIKIHT